MSQILVPIDAETALIHELTHQLPQRGFNALAAGSHAVSTKLPIQTPKPSEFVRVTRTGGIERDYVTDWHQLTLEGFSVHEMTAERLTAVMIGIVDRAVKHGSLGGLTCYATQGQGVPVNLPHPGVPTHHRYTTTLSVAFRKAAV